VRVKITPKTAIHVSKINRIILFSVRLI